MPKKTLAMKTGIIGGTFNPIHNGHLNIADELLINYQLDRIIFIPAALPPHKKDDAILSFAHRLTMVQLATAHYNQFEPSDIEAKRSDKSYSVDTLNVLHQLYPGDQFYFLIGMDSLKSLHTWYKYTHLFDLCHLVVARRPGVKNQTLDTVLPVAIREQFCYNSKLKTFCHNSGHQLIFLEDTFLDISSTQIRANIADNQAIDSLVPPSVAEYIKTHHLYAPPKR